MTHLRSLLQALSLSAAALSLPALAQLKVEDAWVRATVAQQKATGAFMVLTASQNSKLVAASSPLTPSVEVHEMAMQDNVMKMRQIPALALPAGQPVALKPGGYHVMLLDLRKPIQPGDTVPLTLTLEDAQGKRQSVEVQAVARALNTPSKPPASTHQH
jgi:copper(I)-binding protein